MNWLPDTVRALREFDVPWWAAVLLVFGLALIWKGPDWIKIILTHRLESKKVTADIKLKQEKAAVEIAAKLERSRKQAGKRGKKVQPGEQQDFSEVERLEGND